MLIIRTLDNRIFTASSLAELQDKIPQKHFLFKSINGDLFSEENIDCLSTISEPQLLFQTVRLLGGKGGFGSQLRAQGGRMSAVKITNFEACRDLQGRRLHTIHNAQAIAEHMAKKPLADKKKKEKMKNRIERALMDPVERVIQNVGTDEKWVDERSERMEKIGEIVQKVTNVAVEKPVSRIKVSSKWDLDEDDDDDDEEENGSSSK